jgi:hypothetical protein
MTLRWPIMAATLLLTSFVANASHVDEQSTATLRNPKVGVFGEHHHTKICQTGKCGECTPRWAGHGGAGRYGSDGECYSCSRMR